MYQWEPVLACHHERNLGRRHRFIPGNQLSLRMTADHNAR